MRVERTPAPGGRARALAAVLVLVLAASLRERALWPAPGADVPRAGVEEDGALRIYDLAEAARRARARGQTCSLELPALEPGAALVGRACALRVRSLPLGARRALGLASDPNQLEAQDFEELRGIGPALAERIVRSRRRLGGFRDLEELRRVPGIGPARMAQLRSALTSAPP